MENYGNVIKEKYGSSISKQQYEDAFLIYYKLCEEHWGKPKMSFTSVTSFGKRVRESFSDLLKSHEIDVV